MLRYEVIIRSLQDGVKCVAEVTSVEAINGIKRLYPDVSNTDVRIIVKAWDHLYHRYKYDLVDHWI